MRLKLSVLFLSLWGILMPWKAYGGSHMRTASNYKAMVIGIDKIQFTLPTQYDGAQNEGIYEGHVYVTVDGGQRQSLFDWNCKQYNNLTSDSESGEVNITAFQGGTFQLTGKVKGVTRSFTSNSNKVTYTLGYDDDDDDHFTSTIVWQVPRSMRGHQLKFELWCRIDDVYNTWYIPSGNNNKTSFYQMYEWACPAAAEVSINVGDPMLSYDAEHVNQQMFTYSVVAKKIHWAKLYYTDALTGSTQSKDLDTKNMAGLAYIPADRPYRDIYIQAKVTDSEGKVVDTPIESERKTSKMMHYPSQLKAVFNSQGQAILTWNIEDANQEDVVEGDFFEIQRNVTGSTVRNDANWITVSAAVQYEQGKQQYTYTDESLPNYYTGGNVAYRIRRAYTGMWQWADHSGFNDYLLTTRLVLPSIVNAVATRGSQWNDDGHHVDFHFDFEGQIADDQLTIGTLDEYKAFVARVNAGESSLKAILTSDINLGNELLMVGTETNPFSGEFDGNGFKITVNFYADEEWVAPFSYVRGAIIKNLTIDGKIKTFEKYVGGLVARILNGESTGISKCRVVAEITSSYTPIFIGSTLGGFIAQNDAVTIINDCAFQGYLLGTAYYNSGFVGHAVDYVIINNSLFDPSGVNTKRNQNSSTFVTGYNGNSMLFNCYYTTPYGNVEKAKDASAMSASELVEALGRNWMPLNGTAMPLYEMAVWDNRAKLQLRVNMHGEKSIDHAIIDLSGDEDIIKNHHFTYNLTRNCVEYSFDLILRQGKSVEKISNTDADSLVVAVIKMDEADLKNYRFINNSKLTKLEATTRQSSVLLQWEVSTGEYDYFRVLRRKHSTNANAVWTDIIATDLNQLYFEDKTVLVQQDYDYKVESVYQCEGTNIETKTCTGSCKTTGMVSGYIRLADGTAVAGLKVICTPVGTIPGADAQYTTYSDETGYFEFSDLPYQVGSNGTSNGNYRLTVEVTGDYTGQVTGPNQLGDVTFDQNANWTQNFNFWMDTYYVYSGNIYYRGTSIPVPGVSFKLDGKEIHDASQRLIVTDTQGAFSLNIPAGSHSVQAVKDGHIFMNNGFLENHDAEDEEHRYQVAFNKNVAGVALWDETTVVLHGRVVGGDIQGEKPLGRSLSANNLGDSIKIVMQLEGDNASWLVRDQKDPTIKERHEIYTFGAINADTTKVHTTRSTITIKPDNKTGEYQLRLHPAKYKVIEVSAQGYATLFQEGKVGETIDLAFNVEGDTCVYNRIYHAVPDLTVTQFNAKNEPFYGTKVTTAADNIGNSAKVELWGYKHISDTDSIPYYSLGYPVFMAGSPYGWMLQACEKYYWNNQPTGIVDIVNLQGGTVQIKNYLVSNDETKLAKTIQLDNQGYASYVFTPGNTTTVLEDEMALKNVDFTLQYDGNYYDVKPLNGNIMRGFVMATTPKAEGTYTVAASYPVLIDILRDPPGGSSTSYIEAGSKLSYSYSPTFDGTVGVKMGIKNGTYSTIYNGAVLISPATGSGSESGTISEANSDKVFSFSLASTYNGSWTTSYSIDVTERIQTKSGQKWVGPKADLFMGTNENLIIQDAVAIRAIPEDQYLLMKNNEGGSFTITDAQGNHANVQVKVGAMKVLAQGTDTKGNFVYLVRDEVMGVSNKVQSTFIHSQCYIEDELLPNLAKLRNQLIKPLGTIADPQALANQTKKPVYISKVAVDDPYFGASENVEMYLPSNKPNAVNEVLDYNQQMGYWLTMLAQNEEEKLNVQPNDLVKNYDFDGGAASIQYSESFNASRNKSGYIKWPGLNNANIASLFPDFAISALKDLVTKGEDAHVVTNNDPNGTSVIEAATATSGVKVKFTPILSFNFQDKSAENKANSKKVGFTLSVASKSSMNVDVYRTRNGKYSIEEYSPDPMLVMTEDVLNELHYGQPYHPDNDIDVYSSFVFRTRGGVTCQPYEGERKTKWYQPGTVLDVATVPIDKPNIWIEEPVKSNVPFDEPARFILHMSNESDYPDQATKNFKYFLDSRSNPNGATVTVDGKIINSTSEDVSFYPVIDPVTGKHIVITKEITVSPSSSYDYEDLRLSLYDPDDISRFFPVNFSAHFIPSAGKVKISVPGDHWVINTQSPYDNKRQSWYMPVRIEGFDVNFPNFDHIELQYKLSTQGDKDWVNVCSYYANDSLRAKASGVTDSIPSSGIIVAPFYGETDPIEQYYDIRAVNYCRYAGGFLTRSSEILTGIKDTRTPRPFGTPAPVNGILGIGDDIKISFSEDIAGNYLRKINNFEVLGTPISNDISTSTSLSFDGYSIALTQAERNLKGKNFTIDVMIDPENNGKDMTIFCHGGTEDGMRLGISGDRHLTAELLGKTIKSDKPVDFNNQLHQVAWSIEQNGNQTTVCFFDGSTQIGSQAIDGVYNASSGLWLGIDWVDIYKNYIGNMLEFRLWNRAMTASELSLYSGKTLTGYEIGLMDYYRLNEGEGNFSYDHAPGAADLTFANANWKRPVGISMKLDGQKGIRLKGDKFASNLNQDYTLMFWFRSENENATDVTLLSNGEALAKEEPGKLNIGLKDGKPYVRSSGYEVNTSYALGTSGWNHFAMTVSRPRNVANVYINKQLVSSFAADSLSGIDASDMILGATYVDKNTPKNVLKGNIDEVGMFSCVLPLNLIKDYANHTPLGTESVLVAYLDFGRSERQEDNTMRLMPTGISLKRYKDNQGNVVARRDTLLVISETDVDRNQFAPMASISQLDNLNFDFVVKDNELLMELLDHDFQIEKTNVYVTVKDVADRNGNLLESPIMLNLYVYRNPLRWNVKRITKNLKYGEGVTFEATIQNLSGVSQNYDLLDIPMWITPSKNSGTIGALDEEIITFTVSPCINIGNYNEQISLVGGNNMNEPLPLMLTVRGEEPSWAVSNELKKKNLTMQMVAQVKIDGIVTSSSEDILGVFDQNGQVLGVAHIDLDNQSNANHTLAYVTIYSSTEVVIQQPTLYFKYFHASSGNIYSLQDADKQTYVFKQGETLGSATQPVVLVNTYNRVQVLSLKQGWNWISFNVKPSENITVGELLYGAANWEPNDVIEGIVGDKIVTLLCRADDTPRGYRWTDDDKVFNIDPHMMYRIYSCSDKVAYIAGDYNLPVINLQHGWNRIAYLSSINLPIEQAMNDYLAKASEGDVLKSQDAFAIVSHNTVGQLIWKGSLKYMETGKGYMLKRTANSNETFIYPEYWSDSRYSGSRIATARMNRTATSMNIVARISGITVEPGDRLSIYNGAECCGFAEVDDEQLFYLNIGEQAKNSKLRFSIERGGKVAAVCGSNISYQADQLLGTPEQPTIINFMATDHLSNGEWYTITGIKLPKQPTAKGYYIHNGKIIFVK